MEIVITYIIGSIVAMHLIYSTRYVELELNTAKGISTAIFISLLSWFYVWIEVLNRATTKSTKIRYKDRIIWTIFSILSTACLYKFPPLMLCGIMLSFIYIYGLIYNYE